MVPGCAHTCTLVGDLVAELARMRGLDEATARVGLGLVAVVGPAYPCRVCGLSYDTGKGALDCADFHHGSTD